MCHLCSPFGRIFNRYLLMYLLSDFLKSVNQSLYAAYVIYFVIFMKFLFIMITIFLFLI